MIIDLYELLISTAAETFRQPGLKGLSSRHAVFDSMHHPLPSARSSKEDPGELLCQVQWQGILLAFALVGGKSVHCPLKPVDAKRYV
jgi:hypothetical protein